MYDPLKVFSKLMQISILGYWVSIPKGTKITKKKYLKIFQKIMKTRASKS